jgi:hypothetical protein
MTPELTRGGRRGRTVDRRGAHLWSAARQIGQAHAELVRVAVQELDVSIANRRVAPGCDRVTAELEIDGVLRHERSPLPLRKVRGRPEVAVLLIFELQRRDFDVQLALVVADIGGTHRQIAPDLHQRVPVGIAFFVDVHAITAHDHR